VAWQGGAKLTGVAWIALDHGQSFLQAHDLLGRADECCDRVAACEALVH
jgi:hypothetical protein